jgi:hypothetical protein
MTFHKTIPGGGLCILLCLLAMMLQGCAEHELEPINLTAADCAGTDAGCYL